MKEKGPCRRLRRRWLRVNLVLTYTGLAGFALAIAIAVSGGPETAAIALVLAATALVLAAGVVDLLFLRCPGCGRTIAMGNWRPGKQYRCRRCGKLYLFDDDPPERKETEEEEEP